VLTPTQCMMLRQDAQVIGMKRAPVLSKDGVTRTVSRTRTCTSCWIPFAPHYKWLYSIINELTMAINAEHYRFDVTGVQQLQILRYSPLQRFSWHWDTFTGSDRKLTKWLTYPPQPSTWAVDCKLRLTSTTCGLSASKGRVAGSHPTSNIVRVRLSGVHAGCWWLG
jgi:hypothetical protein